MSGRISCRHKGRGTDGTGGPNSVRAGGPGHPDIKNRYEYANRVMEILVKHSNASSSCKQDIGDIFGRHKLDFRIHSDYCN